MLNSTLLDILRTFDKEQLKKFELFVISPYHNNNSNVIGLFHSIKKYFPEFRNSKLNREQAWGALFPGRKFHYGVMKNLIFGLQNLAEKFLSLEKYETKEFEQGLNLLDALFDKNLISLLDKNIKYFNVKLSKSKINLRSFYYKYAFQIYEQSLFYRHHKIKYEDCIPAEKLNENFLTYFLINFFNSNYNELHRSILYNDPYDRKSLDLISEFFKKSPVKKNKYVNLFFLVIGTLLDTNDESLFYKLKNSFNRHSGDLAAELRYNISLALINCCTHHIMKGNTKFIKEQFNIYKLMIESGYYNDGLDKFIDPYMYANIVSMAANLRKYAWAENFIETFKNRLNPSYRDQSFPFAMVSLNLKRKRFDTALEYLSQVKSGNVIDKMTIRRFQLMIYYESEYIDELSSLIDSSKHFISNDYKTSPQTKNIFKNFLYFVIRFTSIKSDLNNKKYDEYYFKKLEEQIREKEISNKIWLLEKLNELMVKKIPGIELRNV